MRVLNYPKNTPYNLIRSIQTPVNKFVPEKIKQDMSNQIQSAVSYHNGRLDFIEVKRKESKPTYMNDFNATALYFLPLNVYKIV